MKILSQDNLSPSWDILDATETVKHLSSLITHFSIKVWCILCRSDCSSVRHEVLNSGGAYECCRTLHSKCSSSMCQTLARWVLSLVKSHLVDLIHISSPRILVECWHLSTAVQGDQHQSMFKLYTHLTGEYDVLPSDLNSHPYRTEVIWQLSDHDKEVHLQFCH